MPLVNMTKKILFISFLLATCCTFAQPAATANNKADANKAMYQSTTASFEIHGTSSIHDWVMTSESCTGLMQLLADDSSVSINEIEIQLEVTSLKSGKKVMDNKCYDALKSDAHPEIVFQLTEILEISDSSAERSSAVFRGLLKIAGVSKAVDVNVDIVRSNGTINIQGKKNLKMSDFAIEPPKALLGTLKTGNDIVIVFNLNFNEL